MRDGLLSKGQCWESDCELGHLGCSLAFVIGDTKISVVKSRLSQVKRSFNCTFKLFPETSNNMHSVHYQLT